MQKGTQVLLRGPLMAACFFLFFFCGWSQDLDSMERIVQSNAGDLQKAQTCYHLTGSYHMADGEKAIRYADQGIALCDKIGCDSVKYEIYAEKGKVLVNYGRTRESFGLYKEALAYFIKQNDVRNQAAVYAGLGVSYWIIGDYNEAFKAQSRSIAVYESLHDSSALANAYNNAGLIYKDWGAATKNKAYLEKGCRYFINSLTFSDTLVNNYAAASAYNNLGSTYLDLYSVTKNRAFLKSSEYYLNHSLKIKLALGNKRKISINYATLGSLYYEMEQYDKALDYSTKSFEVYTELRDTFALVQVCQTIGTIFDEKRNYAKAISFYRHAIDLSLKAGDIDDLSGLYENISVAYSHQKDFEKAFDYHLKYTALKDSLLSSENSQKLAEMSEKFNSEKKEKENQLLQAQNKLSGETIRQQKVMTYFMLAFLAVVTASGLFVYRSYRVKKRINTELESKNNLIEKQKAEAEKARALIEEKQKEILDSIHYAKRIQQSLLPSEKYIEKNLKKAGQQK